MVLGRLLIAAVLLAGADASDLQAVARGFTAVEHSNGDVALRITDALSRRYRSALRDAAVGKPDFAGRYVLAEIGCGAGCIRLAAIDRLTGRIAWFPFSISNWPVDVTEPLKFSLNSRLLVVQGQLDEKGSSKTRRYRFDGSRFELLPVPLPRK